MEVGDHRQYTVRMDGSRRCTLRNRHFLRKIQPVCSDGPMPIISTPRRVSPHPGNGLFATPQPPTSPCFISSSNQQPLVSTATSVQKPAATHKPVVQHPSPSTPPPLLSDHVPQYLNFETSPVFTPGIMEASAGNTPPTPTAAIATDITQNIPTQKPPASTPGAPQRSLHERHPTRTLSPCPHGKSHNYSDL